MIRSCDVMKRFSGFRSRCDDAAIVGGRKRLRHLCGVLDRLAGGEPLRVQPLAKSRPFQELGDQVRCALVHADVVQREHAGMVQRRGRARFLLEPAQQVLVGRERRRQDLDGDRAYEPGILGAIDTAHAALADKPGYIVAPDACRCVIHRWTTP